MAPPSYHRCKAYRGEDGKIRQFRPDLNIARFNKVRAFWMQPGANATLARRTDRCSSHTRIVQPCHAQLN